MAEQLSAVAGGFDVLAANVSTYYDAYYTAAEKTANVVESITQAFEEAEVTLAGNRAEYRAMVDNIDRTTEAGREMFATLMALSGQAATYYDILEGQLLGAANNAYAALQRSIANQQQEIQRAASGTAAAINALTGVSNSLDAALKRLRGSSDDTVRMLRAQAVMTLNSALVTARAGGSLADYAGLQDALDVASNMDTSLYRSLEDFEREQGRTANLIAELEKVNGKQLSAEQKMLEQYEKQLAGLDQQLAFAQAQLDALNGIDNSIMSVAAAIAAMNASVVAALQGLPKGAAQANTPQNNRSIVDSIYQSVLGRGTEGDEAGAAFWANALQSGTATYQDIAASIAKGALGNSAESAATKKSAEDYLKGLGIPGFASGGLFGGGMRIVGEKGPELEVTGPSRIYNASQTAAMLGGAGSTEELRALRSEVAGLRSALGAIAKYTESTAYGVRQMNEIGLPQPEAA
jgi:prefoldin subunit 5